MRLAWQVAGALFLLLGILVIIGSREYPFFDRLGPGPGFFPFWLGLLLTVLGALLFAQITGKRYAVEENSELIPEREGAIRIALLLAGMVALVLMLNPLGFRISMLLFLAYVPLALGARNWWAISITSIVGSFGIFHVFYYWLKVPLPMGNFGI